MQILRTLIATTVALLISAGIYAATMVSADFSQVRVFPNPWRVDQHPNLSVMFDHLPDNSSVKIFTTSGRLVRSLTASGTSVAWDRTNDQGESVASGVYLYVINVGDQTNKGKLIIIR